MIYNTETDLHTLLDGLTDGEHVKATWKVHGEDPTLIDVAEGELVDLETGEVTQ